jgi:hypothetical protein
MYPQAPARIVSGGQTGADRAALDAARALGIPTGGWVPRGRAAEDGPLPDAYRGMTETASPDPAVRTEWNVRDSHATLLLSHGSLTGGSAFTRACAKRWSRPLLHLDLRARSAESAEAALRDWLEALAPRILNVAGPRASEDPEIYAEAHRLLLRVLAARGPDADSRG